MGGSDHSLGDADRAGHSPRAQYRGSEDRENGGILAGYAKAELYHQHVFTERAPRPVNFVWPMRHGVVNALHAQQREDWANSKQAGSRSIDEFEAAGNIRSRHAKKQPCCNPRHAGDSPCSIRFPSIGQG